MGIVRDLAVTPTSGIYTADVAWLMFSECWGALHNLTPDNFFGTGSELDFDDSHIAYSLFGHNHGAGDGSIPLVASSCHKRMFDLNAVNVLWGSMFGNTVSGSNSRYIMVGWRLACDASATVSSGPVGFYTRYRAVDMNLANRSSGAWGQMSWFGDIGAYLESPAGDVYDSTVNGSGTGWKVAAMIAVPEVDATRDVRACSVITISGLDTETPAVGVVRDSATTANVFVLAVLYRTDG